MHKYRFRMYESLQNQREQILKDARKAADDIGIPADLRGNIGLTAAGSSRPALLRSDIIQAISKAARKPITLRPLVDEIRELVKSYYGDGYDAVPTNCCEAALELFFHVFVKPSEMGGGSSPTRYIGLYERHIGEHFLTYGTPLQARYKDIFADKGSTSGELGVLGNRLNNVEVIIVPLEGAKYPCHGVKSYPVASLTGVDPERSIEKIRTIVERHAPSLKAIVSLGYDTVGYGYGTKDSEGTPLLQRYLGELADDYDILYLSDNAKGIPFIGTDLRKVKADVMVYSMDKVAGGTISGLMIGEEDVMIPLRRAMGFHSDRQGTISSYGKAFGASFDPGREGLIGQIAALKVILESPEKLTRPIDDLYEIVLLEFKHLQERFNNSLLISKSYNCGMVEVNYEKTWEAFEWGIPIFPGEDRWTGNNILNACLSEMGIVTLQCDDGNIGMTLGLGTLDEDGQLLEEETRCAVKALVRSLEILCKYAGVI